MNWPLQPGSEYHWLTNVLHKCWPNWWWRQRTGFVGIRGSDGIFDRVGFLYLF